MLAACVCAVAQTGTGGYAGPSILSRGGSSAGDRSGATAGFQFYAGVTGSYETGIVPASVDSQGNIVDTGELIGVIGNVGAYGTKSWRRTTARLDYTGNFRHYSNNTYYDGMDHMVDLAVQTQLSRRLTLHSSTAAGTMSRYYIAGPGFASDLIANPNYAIFDNRAYYLQTVGGFTYQWSTRSSFSGAGDGFFVRRQSNALVGLNGYGAIGSYAYRMSRTRTIDLSYNYLHFDYPRGFGESDLHTYLLGIAQTLSKRWEIAVAGGVSQISTIGLEEVALDPVTAALFGTTTSVQAFSRSVLVGSGQANLVGTFKKSRMNIYYNQRPSAGNGVYLTSKQSAAGATYSYTGYRKASLSASVNYNSMTSIGQQELGSLSYVSGGVSASYKLLRSLEASAQYEARDLQIEQTGGFARLSYRIAFGLNYHPSEIPISFW